MKKTVILTLAVFLLSGCGNKTFFDTTYTFTYAQIKLPSGDVVEGKIIKWNDYNGEQLQIHLDDGNTYLTSANNVVMTTSKISIEGE